jgi:hypothetical protein
MVSSPSPRSSANRALRGGVAQHGQGLEAGPGQLPRGRPGRGWHVSELGQEPLNGGSKMVSSLAKLISRESEIPAVSGPLLNTPMAERVVCSLRT